MKFFSICSHPVKGNAYFLSAENDSLIIDAGFTKHLLHQTLHERNIDPTNIQAVILSHSHAPHTKGLKFLLSLNPDIFVLASRQTLSTLSHVQIANAFPIHPRAAFNVGVLSVYPFPVKHSSENFNFVFQHEENRLAFITNTGNIDKTLIDDIGICDNFLIESHYHPGIARKFAHWEELKRIVVTNGHLSNERASEIVARTCAKDAKNVVLCNVSKYNDPMLAMATTRVLFEDNDSVNIQIAPSNYPSPVFESFSGVSLIKLIERLSPDKQQELFEKLIEMS